MTVDRRRTKLPRMEPVSYPFEKIGRKLRTADPRAFGFRCETRMNGEVVAKCFTYPASCRRAGGFCHDQVRTPGCTWRPGSRPGAGSIVPAHRFRFDSHEEMGEL